MSEARAAGKAGPPARNEAAPAARHKQGRRCGRSPGQAGCYRNRAELRPSGLAYVPAPLLPGGRPIPRRLSLTSLTARPTSGPSKARGSQSRCAAGSSWRRASAAGGGRRDRRGQRRPGHLALGRAGAHGAV